MTWKNVSNIYNGQRSRILKYKELLKIKGIASTGKWQKKKKRDKSLISEKKKAPSH